MGKLDCIGETSPSNFREFAEVLIMQNRLIAGVHFLDEVPNKLRQNLLLINEKIGQHSTAEDAETLPPAIALSLSGTFPYSP